MLRNLRRGLISRDGAGAGVAAGGAVTSGRRVRRFSGALFGARFPGGRGMRGRRQRDRADIFQKRALVAARQPFDGVAKRQPVHGPHVAHQFMNRLAAASMRQ